MKLLFKLIVIGFITIQFECPITNKILLKPSRVKGIDELLDIE